MDQDQEFNLDIEDDVLAKIDEIGNKAGCSQEQVIEYIIREFLMLQLRVIQKRAQETDSTMADLVNMQFARLVDFIYNYPDQFRLEK